MKRPRYLIVQSCHIPHFFYAVRLLRKRFPDATIDALMVKDEQVRYYVGLFGGLDKVHYLPEVPEGEYDGIVFPLVNRGYRTIKLAAWSVRGPKLDMDFEGQLTGLSAWGLRKSYFLPLHTFTREFQDYLATFPHRPIGESVLFCHSCDYTLVRRLEPEVKKYLAPGSDICVVRSPSLRAALRRIRGRAFDSAVVFFSAEKGFAHLKVLPFLLRIRKILVVNENGDCIYASPRSLAGFLLLRLRSGFRQPRPLPPRILVFQTSSLENTARVIKRISVQARFKQAEILVVCDKESRARLRILSPVKRVLSLSEHPTLRERLVFWRRLRQLTPDLTVAALAGSGAHRFHKLMFWLLPARRLFFTAAMECYRLSPRTLLLPFPEQLSETADALDASEGTILFVDGTRSAAASEAVKMLGDSKIVRPRPIVVLCAMSRKKVFQDLPGILQIVGYRPWNPFSKLLAVSRCLALNVDVVTGIFAGRRFSRINQFLLFMLPARHRLVFNQHMGCFYASGPSLGRVLRTLTEPAVVVRTARKGHTLFVDTVRSSRAVEAVGSLNDPRIIRRQPIEILCREDRRTLFETLPGVRAIHTYRPWRPIENLKTLTRCASLDVDVIAGVFDASRPRRWLQFFLFLLPARHRLVFNRYGGCFYADREHFPLLLRNLIDATPPVETVRPILFVDKPGSDRAPEAARKLRSRTISRKRRPVTVVCPKGREELYRDIPGVERIHSYGRGGFAFALLRVRRIVGLRPEIMAVVLDGHRLSRVAQLLALAFPARHRLVFNQGGDCFYLSPWHLGPFWGTVREPDAALSALRPILFIDRPGSQRAPKAARKLRSRTISPEPRSVVVVCPKSREALYKGIPGVKSIQGYGRGGFLFALFRVRRTAGLRPEIVATLFDGRRLGRLAQLFALALPARHRLIFNQSVNCFYLNSGHLGPFWRTLRERDSKPAVLRPFLFIDRPGSHRAPKAARKLRSRTISPELRSVVVVCPKSRETLYRGIPGVKSIQGYGRGGFLFALFRVRRTAGLRPEIVATLFDGRRLGRFAQLFALALPARHRLIFNQSVNCFYLNSGHLGPFWRTLRERDSKPAVLRPILFIDKPGSHRAPQAARKLQGFEISPEPRPVAVICPKGREALYRGIPGIEHLQAYGKWGFAFALLRARRIAGWRPEIVSTVLDGRRSSRLTQLFALALPARHRLVFNQNVDCFFFSIRHFGRFWRALRERDEVHARRHSYSLFVQTAEDEKAVRALQMLNDPEIARPRPILVFCRRDKLALFREEEGVHRVFTYEPSSFYSNLRTVGRFLTIDIEVVAAVFTGRPIYRVQKLLFFALPARHRLAFNSHLDCFYLTSRNWSTLLARDRRQSAPRRLSPVLRVFLKASLFFPRFLYLVIWVTGLKMKRAYTQVPEVK